MQDLYLGRSDGRQPVHKSLQMQRNLRVCAHQLFKAVDRDKGVQKVVLEHIHLQMEEVIELERK
jgi:hypothetical protein